MKSKKTLKGFTLIEMIVVVAIFGMIMAAALSMIGPVNKVYNNAYNENDTQAISENLRRYVGDQLQYADRMAVYTGMSLDGASSPDASVPAQVKWFRENYFFVPKTVDVNESGTIVQKVKERVYPYSGFKGNDEVFVLHISNPPSTVTAGSTVSVAQRYGTITLTTYKGGIQTGSKIWSANTDYYEDYAFNFSIQTAAKVSGASGDEYKYIDLNDTMVGGKISPTNIAMEIDMYRKHPIKPDYLNAVLDETYTSRTVTFKLKNLFTKTNALSVEKVVFTDNVTFGDEEFVRFNWFDNTKSNANPLPGAAASDDIYFIFTKSPVIEDLV